MKLKKRNKARCAAMILAGAVAGALHVGLPAQAAENWYPSKYGVGDTLGAANNLSPDIVRKAAKLVTTGRAYSLAIPSGPDTPTSPHRAYRIIIAKPGFGAGEVMGSNKITANDDILFTWVGHGTQIDGLGHIGIDHVYYNGVPARDFVGLDGIRRFSIDKLPPIVTRGVLLDMAAFFGVEMMEGGQSFNSAEIKAAARRQGVEIRKGDVVLFNTGWMALAFKDNDRMLASEPGLGMDGARYLAKLGVVAVGADTPGVEVAPGEDPGEIIPVHQFLITKHGVYLLELVNTGELAADKVYEFLFVLGQPKLTGAVQAIINPIAIR